MFTVARTLPNGTTKTSEARTIREAGQHVAFTLHDNTGMTKREATKAGMQAEKERHLEIAGYTFSIERS